MIGMTQPSDLNPTTRGAVELDVLFKGESRMTVALVPSYDPAEARAAEPAATLADQLVVSLAEVGINTYFGVPGGAIEPLFNALARQQRRGRARVIPMRSEGAAAFAADGYCRATGSMAVAVTTTGPGISNLLTAAMNAHADRVPLLILTPQVVLPKQGRGAFQDSSRDGYDLTSMLALCTRYSTTIDHAEQLGHKLLRALLVARSSPSGPVHLSIPADLLGGTRAHTAPDLRSLRLAIPEPVDVAALRGMLDALFEASRPVLYLGADAGPAAHLLCEIAPRLGASVVTSPAGKRWIGHFDAAYKGVVGFSGHDPATDAMRRADLVVALGATFDEFSTDAWTVLPGVPTYSVDQHTAHAHRLPGVRPVIAKGSQVLRGVLERWPKHPRRERALSTLPPATSSPSNPSGAVHPPDLMRWLSGVLPADVVVHVDTGTGFAWSTKYLRRPRPDTYRVAMGLCAMGWAVSAAIGAAVAHRRRTVAIIGDGSMLMSSLEITVAVQLCLPITYLVLNDSGLGMVRHGQQLAGAESIAHEIPSVRFDGLAQACGAHGLRVQCRDDLERVPGEWLCRDDLGPCIIDVAIDREAVPPIRSRVMALPHEGAV